MCYTCYLNENIGEPIVNDKTRSVAKMIDDIYYYHAAGSTAHVVVDDWNLEDDNIDFCIQATKDEREILDEERACVLKALEALKQMTKEERYSTMAIHSNFIN